MSFNRPYFVGSLTSGVDGSSEGGRLSIEISNCSLDARAATAAGIPAGDYVALDVADSGCGMDEETRAHLFQPFFTTKQPGQGTRMRVLLPQVKAELEWRGSEAHNEPSLEGQETVLLVEDDERVRASVEQVLAQCGYRLLVAADGAGALRLVRRHRGPIHLLLVDLVMPGKNGREVVKQIAPLYPRAQVLFISGYGTGSGEDVADSRIFRKPFTGGALARKVREVLDAVQQPAEVQRATSTSVMVRGTDSARRK